MKTGRFPEAEKSFCPFAPVFYRMLLEYGSEAVSTEQAGEFPVCREEDYGF